MNNLQFKVLINRSSRAFFGDYDLLIMTLRISSKKTIPNFNPPNVALITADEYNNCRQSFVPIWTNLAILSAATTRSALTKLMEDITYALNSDFNIPAFVHSILYTGSTVGADRLPDKQVTNTAVGYAGTNVHQINYWAKETITKGKNNLIAYLKDTKSPSVIALDAHVHHYHEMGEHTCDVEVTMAVKQAVAAEAFFGQPETASMSSYTYRHLYSWFNLFTERSTAARDIFFYDDHTLEDSRLELDMAYGTFTPSTRATALATLKRALSYFQETIYSIKTPIIKTLKEALRVANLLPVRKSN